jgi:hypothetical protein
MVTSLVPGAYKRGAYIVRTVCVRACVMGTQVAARHGGSDSYTMW